MATAFPITTESASKLSREQLETLDSVFDSLLDISAYLTQAGIFEDSRQAFYLLRKAVLGTRDANDTHNVSMKIVALAHPRQKLKEVKHAHNAKNP